MNLQVIGVELRVLGSARSVQAEAEVGGSPKEEEIAAHAATSLKICTSISNWRLPCLVFGRCFDEDPLLGGLHWEALMF